MRAFLAFGRMNPPTAGHSIILDALEQAVDAEIDPADAFLFVTHSTNTPKDYRAAAKSPDKIASILRNPLTWEQKVDIISKIYGDRYDHVAISDDPHVKTLNDAFNKLHAMGYTEAILICGSDRVEQFDQFIDAYQKDPNTPTFDILDAMSAGDRDPDSDDVTGLSATKMRQFVLDDDFDAFVRGVDTTDRSVAKELFDMVKQGLTIPATYLPKEAAIAEQWVSADKLDNIREDYTALDFKRLIDELTNDGYRLSQQQMQEVLDIMKEKFIDRTRTAAQVAYVIHARPIDILPYL
jgi:hypothetical protein